jgi:hypothetical protein
MLPILLAALIAQAAPTVSAATDVNASLVTLVGVMSLVLITVLKEGLTFFRGREPGSAPKEAADKSSMQADKMADQVDDLHKLHDVKDADGVPVWYVRRSLEEAVKSLADATNNMAAVTERMAERLNGVDEKLGKVRGDIRAVSTKVDDVKDTLRAGK